MRNMKNPLNTTPVTTPQSHSDSKPPAALAALVPPADLHESAFYGKLDGHETHAVAVTRVTLKPWCDSTVSEFSYPVPGKLAACMESTLACLHRAVPNTAHAILINGIQHYEGGPLCFPRMATLRQYAGRICTSAYVCEGFGERRQESLLLVPTRYSIYFIPKWVWMHLVGRILLSAPLAGTSGTPAPLPTHH